MIADRQHGRTEESLRGSEATLRLDGHIRDHGRTAGIFIVGSCLTRTGVQTISSRSG